MRADVSERTIQQAAADLGVECRVNEPLGPHTTMGVGGPAPFLLLPRDAASVAAIVRELAASGTAFRVLGAGSNLIVADEGVRTPVISCARLAATIAREGDGVRAGAGVLVPRLVREMATMGLSGLEFAEGIPGSVGGCVRMNAGAGGRWIGDLVREVVVVTPSGDLQTRVPGPGDFGYRRSFVAAERLIAVEALFEGRPEAPDAIRERMRDSRAYRLATQPLSERSSGCIFKNPESGSAGEVLERLGLKGLAVGGAVLSDVHANFIVNRGGTASDVLALAERVRREAHDRAGVDLTFEVEVWRDAP
jgi:UDP-N-acetylmuramate dehydrogenase